MAALTASRRSFCVALLAVAGLVSVVESRAVPIAGGSCVPECPVLNSTADKSPLGFEPGKTYTYDLDGSTVLSVPASTQEQKITLKGKVKLVVISQCEGAIVLENFEPIDSDGEKSPVTDLDKYPLRFGWNGGKVAKVCPDAADTEKAANIKRAALSALQNSLGSLDNGVKTIKEVDVSGDCETVYDVSVPWTGSQKSIKKTKDLLKCKDRTEYKTPVQFESSLHDLSEINNLPLIRSEHKCEQELSADKVISKVTCTESHAYRPFVQYGKEAEVKVKLALKLAGTSSGANPGPGSGQLTRSCLRYHHKKTLWPMKNAASQAAAMLTHICEATNDGMADDVPDDSYELIHMIRRMTKEEIMSLRDKIRGGQICAATERLDHFFTDLLPQAGGAGAIGVLVHMIKNEKTDAVQRQLYEASMAFDRYPTAESVAATFPLLEGKSCVGAMLGASALAHSYCRINPDCQQDSAITGLISHLARHLDGGCNPSNDEEKDTIIAALKAFGNLGRADEAAEQKILSCATNIKANPAIRVAAIDAFRRMPCARPVKTELLNIFGNAVDDSDVRIEAYITAMGCACRGVISKVQEVLGRKEESRQVIAYVESHVRNLQRTAAPSKQALKQLVAEVKLSDKYKLPNYLKESRNEESSLFSKTLGVGASGEANVIYSQRSYVPRAANLNLTLELFGNTVNIFEFGGRLENMEKRLEGIFGPGGTVRTVAEDLKDQLNDKLETLREKADKTLSRNKRSPVSDHELITNQIDDGFGPKKIYGEEPSADIYVRIFGNELVWVPLTEKKLEDLVAQAEEAGENKLKNVDNLCSWNFLDGAMVIPTVLGVSVKIAVNATVSTGLKYEESNAKFDFPEANLNLKVTPSAVLTVAGTVMVSAYSVKQGARVVGTVKATPSVDFHFESSKNGLQAKLNLPKNDMDLLKISTQSYFVTKSKGSASSLTPLKLDKSNKERTVDACVPGMGKVLGVKLCFSGKYLGPSGFPSWFEAPGRLAYTGEVGVTLKREDPGIQGYELVGKWDNLFQNGKAPELTLYVDAPGSTEDRKIGLSLGATTGPERKYEIFLNTPWNKMAAIVDYVDSPTLNRFGAKVQCSDKTWAFNVATGLEKSGDRRIYTPVIDYTTPSGGPNKVLEGKIEYLKGKVFDFDLKPALEGTSWQGSFAFDWAADKRDVEIKKLLLEVKDHKVSTSGSLKLGKPNYSFDLVTEFGQKANPESVKVAGNLVDNSRRDFAHFKGDLSSESSLLKEWGQTKVAFETKKEPGHWLNEVVVTRGLEQSKFTLHEDIRYSGLASLSSLSVDAEIKMSDRPNSDSGFELLHTLQVNSKHLKHLWDLDYTWEGQKKAVKSLVDLTDNGSIDKADLALKATLSYPGKSFEFTDSFVETEKGVYKGNSELKVTPGDTYNLKLDIVDVKKEGEQKQGQQATEKFDAVLTSTGWTNPVEVTISRVLVPGVLTFDTEVRAEGEQKLHAEAEWHIRDGEGAHALERFDVSALLFLKNIIDAKGSAKNEKPRTELELSVEFPKLEDRKIEAKATITEATPIKRNINAVLAWDAKKNPNKKLSVDSEITKPDGKWELDTKTTLKYLDDEYGLNLKGSLARFIDNGKSGVEAELTLPSGKSLFADTHFQVATEASTYQNEILLNFKTLDNDYYKLKLKTDVKNKNYRQITGNLQMDAQIDIPIWGGSSALKVDSTKRGNSRDVAITGTVTPNAKSDPFEGRLTVGVEPGKSLSLGTKLSHGADVYLDTSGVAKFDVSSKVKEVDLQLSFKGPKLDLSEVSIDAQTTSYWNSIDDAKTTNKLTVAAGGAMYVVSNVFQAVDKRITGSASAQHNGDKMGSLIYSVDRTTPNVYISNVEVDAFGNKFVADFEHRDEPKWWKMTYGVRADLLMLGIEPSEHKLSVEKKDNAARLVSSATMDGEEVYTLKADASLDRKAPSLKASLSRAGEKPVTLDLALKNKRGRGGYGLEGKAWWSDPEGYAEFSGEAKYTAVPLAFEVVAKLDSPEFKIKKWEVIGSSKLDGNKRTLLVKAGNADDKEAYLVELEYVKDDSQVKGNGRLGFQTHKYTTEFSLPIDWVNQDVPASVVIKSTAAAGSKQQVLFKDLEFKREKTANYKEVVYTLKSAMKKSTYTLKLDVLNNRPERGVDGKVTLTFKAKAKRQESVYSTVAALSTQNEALVAEIITSQGEGEDAKKFGISTDLRNGKVDASLYILERVIRDEVTWSGWTKNENGKWKLDVGAKFWLDFKRDPEQVLTHVLEIRELDALKGCHWTGSLVVRHPDLEKDLKITDELVLFGEDRPLYFKAHLDIYGAKQQPLELSVEQTHTKSGDDWECRSAVIVSRPADIDFRMVRYIKKEGHVLTANAKISGGKTERDSSAVEAHASIDCGDLPKMNFYVRGPGQSLELEGAEEASSRKKRATTKPGDGPEEDKWVWTLKQTDSVPIRAEIAYSTDISLPSLSIQVYDADVPGKRLRWRSGYANPTTLDLKFDSVDNGAETLYVRRTIVLRDDHVLSHKLSWRENNFRGLWEGAKYRGKMVGEHVLDGVKSAHQLVTQWHNDYKAAGRLEPANEPLKQWLTNEVEEFIEELESDPTLLTAQAFIGIEDLRGSLEAMVDSVKNAHKAGAALFEKLLEVLERTLGDDLGFTVADINNLIDRTGDEMEKLWKDLRSLYQTILDEVKSGKDEIDIEVVLKFLDSVLQKAKTIFDFANDFVKQIKEEYKVDEIMEKLELLNETVDTLMHYVWECRYFKPLKEFYDEAKKWFREEFKIDRTKVNQVLDGFKDSANDAFTESGGKFVVWKPDEGEIEIDIPVPEALNSLRLPLSPFQKFFQSAKDTGILKTVWDFVYGSLRTLDKINYPELDQALSGLSGLWKEFLALFNPSNISSVLSSLAFLPNKPLFGFSRPSPGYFEYYSSGAQVADEETFVESVKHAVELAKDALKYADKVGSAAGIGSLAQSSWLGNFLGEAAVLSPLHAVPPYKSSAYIAGHDHLVSFDRKVHNFAGKCKYLLARENVDGKYSLEADYSGSTDPDHPTKSLIFNAKASDGSYNVIEIAPDYSVKLNGQPANPPFKADKVWVTRESPSHLQVHWDEEGVTLTCQTWSDFCRFRVSGWVHGRVSGLLGSNDRERVTDMLSPSGEKVETVEDLASKWKVSQSCQDAPRAYAGPGLPACGKAFNDEFSPFGDCFKRVDPEPFRQACMQLPLSDKDGFCRLADAYRMACFEKGKTLPQVEECEKCEFEGRTLNEGIQTEVKTSATEADVVVVINQADCFGSNLAIEGFVKDLRSQATDEGITDLHVGLVGYGNKDIDSGNPTVLTSGGQVWFEGDIPGFDLKGQDNRGTISALLMATSFEFRPTATKAIVLLTCKPCQRRIEDMLLGRYYQVEKELLRRGITLHALSVQDILVKAGGKKKIQKQVIGVDGSAAYKVNSLKGGKFQPDNDLRTEVSLEPDYCTQLAQSSHGSVFSLARLREAEDKAKNFREVFARRVVASLTGPQSVGVCQRCSCSVNPWGRPVMKCELCEPRAGDLGYRAKDQA